MEKNYLIYALVTPIWPGTLKVGNAGVQTDQKPADDVLQD